VEGSRVWLYLHWVKEGYARKLAHMWHGPFRVVDRVSASLLVWRPLTQSTAFFWWSMCPSS
jgi:hypothetical protein